MVRAIQRWRRADHALSVATSDGERGLDAGSGVGGESQKRNHQQQLGSVDGLPGSSAREEQRGLGLLVAVRDGYHGRAGEGDRAGAPSGADSGWRKPAVERVVVAAIQQWRVADYALSVATSDGERGLDAGFGVGGEFQKRHHQQQH